MNKENPKKNKKSFEYYIAQRKEEFRCQYDHERSWENLQYKLQKRKNHRLSLYCVAASAAFLFLILGVSHIFSLHNNTQNKEAVVAAVVSNSGNAKDTMACFSQSITNTFTSEYSRSTKYSFASLDAIRNTKYIRINDEVSDISKYLSNEFTEDLKNLSADRIVERYGTHVLTDFVIGGRYKLIFRSVIAKQMDSSTKRKAVESSFELSLKKIGFSVNVENSTQIDESLTVENQAKELYILFYGGNGTNLKYDLEKGMPTGVDIQGWENSVKLGNVNLTQINWEETYPIYEFIQDPIKKQEIKMAVERHIEQAQLKTLELLPLYTYSGGDFAPSDISTTTTYIPDYALNKLEYIEGYVLKEQLEGTVPLYYYWTSYFNYTTTKDDISPYISKGIIGYVYASPYTADNLCPLYEYYKLEGIPPTKRYRTSTMSNIPEMDPIWHRDNHLSGYIYPNN